MKSKQELKNLRNLLNQKQSSLNNLLSEKQNINSSINNYKNLNQTSGQDYNNSLKRLQDVENQILQYNKYVEEKLSEISTFEDFMHNMDSILSEYTIIEGQKIDPSTMMVKALPQNEILKSDLHKDICKKKCIDSFEKLLVKLDNVNAVDGDGRTLLMHTLLNGFFPAVDILLANSKLNIDIIDNNGCNALMYACAMPHIKYIDKIIDTTSNNGLNLTTYSEGDTALHLLLKNTGIGNIFSDEISLVKELSGDFSNDLYCTGTLIVNENMTIGNIGGLRQDGYSINQYRSLLICRKLKEKGVDFSILNKAGLAPYFYICNNQQKYLAKCLEDEKIVNLEQLDDSGFQGAVGKLLLRDHEGLKEFIDTNPSCLKGFDVNGYTLLHFSVLIRDLSFVKLIMDSGANQNIKNLTNGITPFFLSCNTKEIEIAKYLLSKSPDLSVFDNNGFDALLWASELKDCQILQELISKGCNINVQDKTGQSTISWMIQYGYNDVVDWLIKNEADINIPNKAGLTPLYQAVLSDNVDAVKLLLDNGANPNIPNNKEEHILAVCVSKNNIDIFNALINHNSTDINYRSLQQKVTPLWLASQDGKDQFVDALIDKGADLNIARIDNGHSPMHAALVKNHFGIFNKLANHPNINIKVTDVNGLSILHYGVHLGRADVIKLAIDKGIDINLSDALGRTSVYWCSLLGNVEMLQFLQQQGADINIQNKAGYHPIYGAVHNNQLCTVETLLKHDKFLVNQPAEENATPLYYSLGYGGQEINIEIIKLLLKHEADVKIAMNDGDTPMHMAHYKSSKEAIELLLENGANLHAQNNDKKTPLHCMLESKTSSQDLKMQVIEAYKQKYDFSIQDKDGKTPIDYAKEYCPTIFSNIGLDINSVTEEDILANLLQNTILTTGNNDDPQNLEAELTGNNIIEENNNTMLD